jgi:hypothetical protein
VSDKDRVRVPFNALVRLAVEYGDCAGEVGSSTRQNEPTPLAKPILVCESGPASKAIGNLALVGPKHADREVAVRLDRAVPRRRLVDADWFRGRQAHSGKSAFSPSGEAFATPRSVMRPVTRRAGVTSKAGFAAGLPSGEIRTRAIFPSSPRP